MTTYTPAETEAKWQAAWAEAGMAEPVLHRRVDVGHEIGDLDHRTESPTHRLHRSSLLRAGPGLGSGSISRPLPDPPHAPALDSNPARTCPARGPAARDSREWHTQRDSGACPDGFAAEKELRRLSNLQPDLSDEPTSVLHQVCGPEVDWSRVNTAESIVGVQTPLSWSFWDEGGELGFRLAMTKAKSHSSIENE